MTLEPDRIGYGEPAPGHEWVWAADNLDWRLIPAGTEKRCRRTGKDRKACGQPAVAELNRSHSRRTPRWWAYCEHHLYGRRIHDGVIQGQRLRPIAPDPEGPSA